ncbi:MAG: alkaline phosphatase family protein [Planctomycetes bacterium]|nr:alkaline phosphatase family protein [Planctomycetota bacterium]
MRARVIGIGLDGFPYTLALRFIEEGLMPNLARLAREAPLVQMDSVLPTVSNVAWSAFQTGRNPGAFGVYGFGEVRSDKSLLIPSSKELRAETIWEMLSRAGKTVISIGVPQTFPPRPVRGILVSGFMTPALDGAVYPPSALGMFREWGYKLDIDPIKARESLEYFKRDVGEVFEARRATLFRLWDRDDWDFLFVHFMETDRVNHFLWRFLEEGGENGDFLRRFYARIDGMLGEVRGRMRPAETLVVLSDHGFTGLLAEVQLNAWLREQGFLATAGNDELAFDEIAPSSKAFAQVPGRIHILRRGVWKGGSVAPEDYEIVRSDLIARLRAFEDPRAGKRIARAVLPREEIFHGPCVGSAPDIVIDPNDGYDLKASLAAVPIFGRGPISGMHTFGDAMLWVGGRALAGRRPVIWDLCPTILEILGVAPPGDLDGRSLLERGGKITV